MEILRRKNSTVVGHNKMKGKKRMEKKHNVLRVGFVAAVLAAMLFFTAPVFAQEDVLEGVARELVLDEKYIIFPVPD